MQNAQANHLSFLANSQYTSLLKNTKAGIVIMSKHNHEAFKGNKIIASDPYVAYAKIAHLFQNKSQSFTGIHQTAIIAENAKVNKYVTIGPYCVIGEHTVIKQGTVLEAHVTIGDNCQIGTSCMIKPNVTISYDSHLGDRVIVHPGAVIGADGFGLARDVKGWIKEWRNALLN